MDGEEARAIGWALWRVRDDRGSRCGWLPGWPG